jgi:hypothetical protein
MQMKKLILTAYFAIALMAISFAQINFNKLFYKYCAMAPQVYPVNGLKKSASDNSITTNHFYTFTTTNNIYKNNNPVIFINN